MEVFINMYMLHTSANHFSVELTVTCNARIFLAEDDGWPGMAIGQWPCFYSGYPGGSNLSHRINDFFFLFSFKN